MGKANGRLARRWRFADCLFDEEDWSLHVAGRAVAIETKPLELLRALLTCPGKVVAKEDLLDRVWPDVTVVEASLTTAVRKLRRALGDDRRKRAIVQTVSGIGYRLAVPVEVEATSDPAAPPPPPIDAAATIPGRGAQRLLLVALATLALLVAAFVLRPAPQSDFTNLSPDRKAQIAALRKLDLAAVEQLIDRGWDPNRPYNPEGDGALNILMNNCEWDPGHDQRKLMLIARTLLDAGADYSRRNRWGDTTYSIARAPRYCGPNHPVTVMLRRLCVDRDGRRGDRCMATYELARGQHFPG